MNQIAFSDIPEALRIPGVYIEFDPRLAGNPVIDFKMLILGQRLSTGSVAEGVLTRVTGNEVETEGFFGRGSQLAEMIKAAKAARPFVEMWAIPMDELGAGVAATQTLTVTGTATESRTLSLYVAGKKVQVAVTSGDDASAVAASIVAAINAQTDLPVTAGAVAGVVTATCRWKGETGEDIDIRLNYNGEKTPAGIAVAIAAGTAGSGNPDISTAIASFGPEWWNWIVTPWTDATNMTALETELDSRYGPLQQIGGRAFCAFRDNLANTSTFGNGRNSPHVSAMATNISPTPTWIWAAVNGAVAAYSLQIDPAKQLTSVSLPGVLAAEIGVRWTDPERNTLLFDGMATHIVARDGTVQIEAQISMYQTNSLSVADDAYLYINTVETLERWRYYLRVKIATIHARQKLADDSVQTTAGDGIAQPKTVRPTILSAYREATEFGWMQDYDGYKTDLVLQIHATDKTRLDVYERPRVIGQLRIVATHSEFS